MNTEHKDIEKSIENGSRRISWAEMNMPVQRELRKELERKQLFKGYTIGICLHIEPKTAVMCRTLQAGGAKVVATGSPGTTNDEVALALNHEGIKVYGCRKDNHDNHKENIQKVMNHKPHLMIDNGADLAVASLQAGGQERLVACTEETTTGANRLREDMKNKISFPVIVINDSPLKQIMENKHGVGQTIVEGFMHTTNLLLPGRKFVVIGYGACGKGIARYLRNLGSQVTVVDQDPIVGLEAILDGFKVKPLEDTLKDGQVFITVTGRPDIIRKEHIKEMIDGAILANAGHFSWEIDHDALQKETVQKKSLSPYVEQFQLKNGKKIILLTRGEMLNLAGSKGNPIETMDLGLALQVVSLIYLVENRDNVKDGPQAVPHEVNSKVAARMLELLA